MLLSSVPLAGPFVRESQPRDPERQHLQHYVSVFWDLIVQDCGRAEGIRIGTGNGILCWKGRCVPLATIMCTLLNRPVEFRCH
jgi:hypothetical protein